MTKTDTIDVLAIVGSGFMGQGIARAALRAGFRTLILYDKNEAALEKAHVDIAQRLEVLRENSDAKGSLTGMVVKEQDLAKAVKDADFVIEAVPEIMELKQQVFQVLAEYGRPQCVFATNTSTLSIDEITKHSTCRDRVIGMHFFVPEESRLIEVTKGSFTSDVTLKKTLEVGDRLPCTNGPRMVVVLDRWSPGFIINRSTAPVVAYLNWAVDRAREKGFTPKQLDVTVEPFMRGFFRTMDFIGLDIVYETCLTFAEELSPDLGPGVTLSELMQKGHLGIKTGKGFYQYLDSGEPVDDGISTAVPPEQGLFDLELVLALQFNECCRIVEEGMLPDFTLIDEYIFAAINSPGPCTPGFEFYEKWCTLLDDLSLKAGRPYFKPCGLMREGEFRR